MNKNMRCPLCNKEECVCDPNKKEIVSRITADKLYKDIVSMRADLLVINVLSNEYYEDCHIQGSINIPLDQFEKNAVNLERDKKIVIYCASYLCSASKRASKILHSMGFRNLLVYEGGTKEWREKGFPTVGSCKLPYLMATK